MKRPSPDQRFRQIKAAIRELWKKRERAGQGRAYGDIVRLGNEDIEENSGFQPVSHATAPVEVGNYLNSWVVNGGGIPQNPPPVNIALPLLIPNTLPYYFVIGNAGAIR